MSEGNTDSGEQVVDAADPSVSSDNNTQEGVEKESQQVPLEALQSIRGEKQKLADENQMLRDNLNLLMSQMNNKQQQQEVPRNDYDGLSKDDVLTVGELENILSKKEAQYEASMKELKMAQKYKDYQEVVTQHLPEVLKQNPDLVESFRKNQDYELAYYLAKNSESYRKAQSAQKQSEEAQRIVKNAERSGSLASTGQTSPINTAKRYKQMSDADFMKEVSKNMGII
ncbi:MAG: hypothetical protein R3230_01220 [Nitrosopumilaceae archaeon]|nr:hypothetical protein [Nitrosopumilaceae archaeon]